MSLASLGDPQSRFPGASRPPQAGRKRTEHKDDLTKQDDRPKSEFPAQSIDTNTWAKQL